MYCMICNRKTKNAAKSLNTDKILLVTNKRKKENACKINVEDISSFVHLGQLVSVHTAVSTGRTSPEKNILKK